MRGPSVTRVSGSVALSSATTPVTAVPAVASPVAHKVAPAPVQAPARKPAKAPKTLAPLASPTPATPGMGMLLKLSAGAPGEVSWFPSRPADNPGASWVL